MWCSVDLVLTDVSEERIASIFFYPEDGGNTFSETSVRTRSTRRHVPEDGILYISLCSVFYELRVCTRD
jgi:hypothetical protein